MEAPDAYELEIFRRLGQTLDDEELELSRLIATVKKNVKELSLSDEAKVAVKEHLEPYVQWERRWRHAESEEAADHNLLYIEVFNRVLMSTFFTNEIYHSRIENPKNVIDVEVVDAAIEYCNQHRRELLSAMKNVNEAELSYQIDQLEVE